MTLPTPSFRASATHLLSSTAGVIVLLLLGLLIGGLTAFSLHVVRDLVLLCQNTPPPRSLPGAFDRRPPHHDHDSLAATDHAYGSPPYTGRSL